MNRSKLRRQIAWEAARLMYDRQESEYYTAKKKAARQICKGWVKPADLPSNVEIRDQIQMMVRLFEGAARSDNLLAMRLAALTMMRRLMPFRPRLIGSVLTGHVRQGSDIDLHVFSDTAEAVTHVLDQDGLTYTVERKQVRKHGEERIFTHVHLVDTFPFELTVYAASQAHYVFKSSITGKAIERASIAELEQFLMREYPELDLEAALLHDVGKAIDPADHVAAGLDALNGFITERTAWLIEHHMLAHQLAEGTLGARARRRLERSENFDDLVLLGECDRAGRQAGVEAPELEEALDYLRELEQMFG